MPFRKMLCQRLMFNHVTVAPEDKVPDANPASSPGPVPLPVNPV
jgi:hypothetical protein